MILLREWLTVLIVLGIIFSLSIYKDWNPHPPLTPEQQARFRSLYEEWKANQTYTGRRGRWWENFPASDNFEDRRTNKPMKFEE